MKHHKFLNTIGQLPEMLYDNGSIFIELLKELLLPPSNSDIFESVQELVKTAVWIITQQFEHYSLDT